FVLLWQLRDEEDEPADAPRELPFVGAILRKVNDALVDLTQEHTGVDHLRRESVEQLVARHGGTKAMIGDPCDRVVDDPQLRAELAVRAFGINCTEAVFPEASA